MFDDVKVKAEEMNDRPGKKWMTKSTRFKNA